MNVSNLIQEPYIQRWLEGRNENTLASYTSAMKNYLKFTGITPKELIEEAHEDAKRPPLEREKLPEQRVKKFFKWVQTQYSRRQTTTKRKDLSPTTARMYIGAIMSFYSEFGYKMTFRRGTFKASPKNRRFNWTVEDVRKFLDACKTLRDRSIVLVLFQSGMDVSTLCSLNIGHVRKELQEERVPLKLDLVRGKTQTPYITFIGEDSIRALQAYLNERYRIENRTFREFRDDEPLFVAESWRRKELARIKPRAIQYTFKNLAIESGLALKEELERTHWNPRRPHSLRGAFASLLRSRGLNQEMIEEFLGHKTSYGEAYFQMDGEKLRQDYSEGMDVLSVYESEGSLSDIEAQLEQQDIIIQSLVERNKNLEEEVRKLQDSEEIEELIDSLIQRHLEPLIKEYTNSYQECNGYQSQGVSRKSLHSR